MIHIVAGPSKANWTTYVLPENLCVILPKHDGFRRGEEEGSILEMEKARFLGLAELCWPFVDSWWGSTVQVVRSWFQGDKDDWLLSQ